MSVISTKMQQSQINVMIIIFFIKKQIKEYIYNEHRRKNNIHIFLKTLIIMLYKLKKKYKIGA